MKKISNIILAMGFIMGIAGLAKNSWAATINVVSQIDGSPSCDNGTNHNGVESTELSPTQPFVDGEWTKGAGWAVSGGNIVYSGSSAAAMQPAITPTFTTGTGYKYYIWITATVTSGTFTSSFGGQSGPNLTYQPDGNGNPTSQTYWSYTTPTTAGNFIITSPSGSAGITITAMSIKLVRDDVDQAVSRASAGDTVLFPAGSCTWSWGIYPGITKGINLIGAGKDLTKITCGGGSCVNYQPSDQAANYAFRVSGFEFTQTFTGGSTVIRLHITDILTSPPTIQTKIRIDHNRLINNGTTTADMIISLCPGFYGVADNNEFVGNLPVRASDSGRHNGQELWNYFPPIIFGAPDNNFYFEDNKFSGINNSAISVISDGEYGNRYAFRYNTITSSAILWPAWDIHGNYGGLAYGTFGVEIYGNILDYSSNPGHDTALFGMRGGRCMLAFNDILGPRSAGSYFAEEHRDSDNPVTSMPPSVQHINNSYFFSNRMNHNGSLLDISIQQDCCNKAYSEQTSTVLGTDGNWYEAISSHTSTSSDRPITGVNWATYWKLNNSLPWTPDAWQPGTDYQNMETKPHIDCCYNGTSLGPNTPSLWQGIDYFKDSGASPDISCGTSLPGTCTSGQVYWLAGTGQGAICSNLSGYVGDSSIRTQNISGSLYKCVSSNNWSAVFTPLAYPHPLRNEGTILYGDVSGDGQVSAYDAALVAQAAVGLITFTSDRIKAGDVDGSGSIAAYDAALIAQKAVGLITKFPVES